MFEYQRGDWAFASPMTIALFSTSSYVMEDLSFGQLLLGGMFKSVKRKLWLLAIILKHCAFKVPSFTVCNSSWISQFCMAVRSPPPSRGRSFLIKVTFGPGEDRRYFQSVLSLEKQRYEFEIHTLVQQF